MGDPFCPLSAMLFPMPRDDRIWSCRSGHGRRNWPRSEDQRSGGTAQGAPEHYSLSASRRPHSSGGLVGVLASFETVGDVIPKSHASFLGTVVVVVLSLAAMGMRMEHVDKSKPQMAMHFVPSEKPQRNPSHL